MPDETAGNSWIWGITQFSIPEASLSPTFLMHSTSWRTRALMKHTRKTTGWIPCSTTKVSNIPTRTSKHFVEGCVFCLLRTFFFKSITSDFPFEEVSLSACFSSYIVFWPKWIGLNWQGWSKSFESGWKRVPPLLWQTLYPRKQEGRNVQSTKKYYAVLHPSWPERETQHFCKSSQLSCIFYQKCLEVS